jgi:predicted acyltransferase
MKVPTRDQSLDAFRGLTVILMVIVNIQGSGDNAFALIKHAEWNGLTLADLVFPWFLLIVGLSLPLSLDRGLASSRWPLVLRRAIMLFLWGMFLSWLIRPTLDPDLIRWSGVLQRIGIVYLACALVILFRPGYRPAALIAVAILIGHCAALLTLTAPGEAAPSLQAGEGISGFN